MSKISVDTTVQTETNDITKSTQNQNTSSATIGKNNNIKNNSEVIQSKTDTDYIVKYSDVQRSFNTKKYNQLSPKAQGDFNSSRSQSHSKSRIKIPQKQLQNVLQSSKFKNQNPSNSKIKQPYFSKLLVDYSSYMYNDLSRLSSNDINLTNKKQQQNLNGQIDEIISSSQRVKTDVSVRNNSKNQLERFSSNQSIELSNIQNRRFYNKREKDDGSSNSRNSSAFKRKYILSSQRQSENLKNIPNLL